MTFQKLAAIAAFSLVSSAIHAQTANSGPYAEIAYTSAKYSAQAVSGSWTPSALRGVVGQGFHEYAAVEAMLLLGVSESTNLGAPLKLESGVGIYLKPRVRFGESAEVFARLGWANINTKVGTTSATDNGTSYGAGASYGFNKTTSLNLDYMVYNEANNSKIDGVSIGVGYKF